MLNIQFTVIATCFNDSNNIISYFEDVCKQTVQPIKYILVDGGSKDDTINKVIEFRAKNGCQIEILCGKRLNIAQGYNEGVKATETDVIIISGIGNKYDPRFFQSLLEYYEENHDEIVYGITYGQSNNYFSKVYKSLYVGKDIGIHSLPTNRGLLIKREVFIEIGYFYEKLVYAGEDVEFFNLAKKNNIKIGFTEKAKLYWDTPRTFTEHQKQKKVYFIGGLQISGLNKKMVIKSILFWALLIIYLLTSIYFFRTVYPYVGLVAIYILVGLRIKNLSPLALILKIYDFLSPVVFMIYYYKYLKHEYKVKR